MDVQGLHARKLSPCHVLAHRPDPVWCIRLQGLSAISFSCISADSWFHLVAPLRVPPVKENA